MVGDLPTKMAGYAKKEGKEGSFSRQQLVFYQSKQPFWHSTKNINFRIEIRELYWAIAGCCWVMVRTNSWRLSAVKNNRNVKRALSPL